MKPLTMSLIAACLAGLLTVGRSYAVPPGYRHAVRAEQPADVAQNIWHDIIVQTETSRIMSVLENRIDDPEVLARTREKLRTLSTEEIRLVSSLCGRISTGERTAQADIVFSLITALIILS